METKVIDMDKEYPDFSSLSDFRIVVIDPKA